MRFRGTLFLAMAVAAEVACADASAQVPCGTHAIPALPDSFFRENLLRTKPAATPIIGAKETLWIQNFTLSQPEQVSFTYRAVNKRSVILVADAHWSDFPSSTMIDPADVVRLGAAFEQNAGSPTKLGRGILDILTSSFAPVSPVGGDSLVYIALTEIKSTYAGGYVVGYVSPNDRIDPALYNRSNYRNLVVLDALSRTTAVGREQTLAHEFLHVLHIGVDRYEERWIDEGIAELSQVLCGYPAETGHDFFQDTDIGLFTDGTKTPTLADYDKSYMIMQYFADQFGVETVGDLVRSPQRGIFGIDAVLASRGFPARFDRDVFPGWAVANLLPPVPQTPGHYAAFDARKAFPTDFGKTTFPLSVRDTLASYGVRYLRAAEKRAQGQMSVSSGGNWNILSVEDTETSPAAQTNRPWHPAGTNFYRDCSLRQPWLVIAPTGIATVNHVMNLQWHAPTSLNPVLERREPAGTGVNIYTGRISLVVSNVDPAQSLAVTVTSARLGSLSRDIRVIRSGLVGTCGEAIELVDSSATPLPDNDIIRVTVSDLQSPLGGVISSADLSWDFGTGEADITAPEVAINLLGSPVLPARVTALVFSNEPLYQSGVTPVSILVNGESVVALAQSDSTGTRWVGSITLGATGAYEFLLRAADLAGNLPREPATTYAALIGSGGVARLASGSPGEWIEFRGAAGVEERTVVLVRLQEDGTLWLGPDNTGWTGPIRIGLPADWIRKGNALERVGTNEVALSAFDPVTGLNWIAVAEPGTYRMTHAAGAPVEFALGHNSPNPFNPRTRIPTSVPPFFESARLDVFAVDGRLLRSFSVPLGNSLTDWDGCDEAGRSVASGVYIARLTALRSGSSAETRTRRMVVVR